ncbi:MAG: hypothetical protein QM736_06710 [Vicinamibacterales bacterium]
MITLTAKPGVAEAGRNRYSRDRLPLSIQLLITRHDRIDDTAFPSKPGPSYTIFTAVSPNRLRWREWDDEAAIFNTIPAVPRRHRRPHSTSSRLWRAVRPPSTS